MPDWLTIFPDSPEYKIIKDFAGPTATVIAATVAAFFAKAQLSIAKSQAQIANDKLKLDLYNRRYNIYCIIYSSILSIINNVVDEVDLHDSLVVAVENFDDAAFLFNDDIANEVSEIGSLIKLYAKAVRKFNQPAMPAENKKTLKEEITNSKAQLMTKFLTLPAVFSAALSFVQLKNDRIDHKLRMKMQKYILKSNALKPPTFPPI